MVSGDRLVLGIDPGKTGRAALLECRPGVERPRLVEPIETLEDGGYLASELACMAHMVVVERQTASPRMGVASAFNMGERYGRLMGGLFRFAGQREIELVLATPAIWRGSFGLKTKQNGIDMARTLVGVEDVDTHDAADAVLLAWWGWKRKLEPVLVSAHETHTDW